MLIPPRRTVWESDGTKSQLDASSSVSFSLFLSLPQFAGRTFVAVIVFPETSDPGALKMTIAPSEASKICQREERRNQLDRTKERERKGSTDGVSLNDRVDASQRDSVGDDLLRA